MRRGKLRTIHSQFNFGDTFYIPTPCILTDEDYQMTKYMLYKSGAGEERERILPRCHYNKTLNLSRV